MSGASWADLSQGCVPDFDIDRVYGVQAELFVTDVRRSFQTGRIEVKAPKPFLQRCSPYVEFKCRGRDGKWRPSGIATSKAELWFFTFGALPGGWVIETEWLREAARRAYKNGQKICESDGSNPTEGVFVTMADLFATRPFNPDGSVR